MKRIWKAFFYSLSGFRFAWQDEAAFRQELILAGLMIPLAFYLAGDKISLILMISSVLLVLALELANSAIEAVVDLVSPEYHILAKKAKDTASAAVLIGLIIMGFVWSFIVFDLY